MNLISFPGLVITGLCVFGRIGGKLSIPALEGIIEICWPDDRASDVIPGAAYLDARDPLTPRAVLVD